MTDVDDHLYYVPCPVDDCPEYFHVRVEEGRTREDGVSVRLCTICGPPTCHALTPAQWERLNEAAYERYLRDREETNGR